MANGSLYILVVLASVAGVMFCYTVTISNKNETAGSPRLPVLVSVVLVSRKVNFFTKMRMQGTVNENAASMRRSCWRSDQPKIKCTKAARADNCVEKVTQQWYDRDQTEILNATVDICFYHATCVTFSSCHPLLLIEPFYVVR